MTNPFEEQPVQPPKPAAEVTPAPEVAEAPESGALDAEQQARIIAAKRERSSPEAGTEYEKGMVAEWLPKEFGNPMPTQEEIDRLECQRKLTELLDLMDAFEANQPIAELYAVTELDGLDFLKHPEKYPVRSAAKQAIAPIAKLLGFLKTQKNLPPEEYAQLNARYTHLARAIGSIRNGREVDHT